MLDQIKLKAQLTKREKTDKTLETSESLKSILDFDFSSLQQKQGVRTRIEELDYLKQRKKSNRARFGKLVADVKVTQKLSDDEPLFNSNDNSDVE